MQVTIRANPHPAQREIHNCPARFRVVDAGRRFGKTRLGVLECLEVAARGKRAYWVAPSYKIAQVGWRPLARMANKIPGVAVKKAEMMVEIPGGGEVWVRSADDPQSLRGEGLDFLVMDEAAYIKQEAWTEALRPALSDKQGRALFISTPNGLNWFWDMYRRADSDPDLASFRFPTRANPYIPPGEIEKARAELPELIFRQEYEAEFVSMEGAVFRRVQEAATAQRIDKPIEGRQYIAGVDVAASVDFTDASVMDVEAKENVFRDRFNRVDYNVLVDRLHATYQRFGMQAMKVEANSIGQPVIDMMRARGMNVIPFTTTNTTKQVIIQNLQAAFEHGQIKILDDPVLLGELLSFESKRNASGSFSYSAPEGMHDDAVMSLALAWDCIANRGEIIISENPFY